MFPITLRSCLFISGFVAAGFLSHASSFASDGKTADQAIQPAQVAPAAAAPPVRTAPGTPPSPECAWTGQRIVMALLRDDVIAADGFLGFYRGFGCPDGHLGRAFGCAVPLANADAAPKRQQIAACWLDPDTASMPKTPVRAEKDDARTGGVEGKDSDKPVTPGMTR